MALLEVRNLSVSYRIDEHEYTAVREVSFSLERGDSLAIVGESGSGKTTVGLAIMGLLPSNSRIRAGSVVLNGVDLVPLPDNDLRRYRWKHISMVFQGSMNALDPIFTVKKQLREVVMFHNPGMKEQDSESLILDSLKMVNLDPSVLNLYPHELSGGMKQRVMIAMALLLHPDVLIADEPTTALDVTTQAEIITLLNEVLKSERMSLIFITHDLTLVPSLCRNTLVLYGGLMMEYGSTNDILRNPKNPYTQALIKSVITLESREAEPIPGDSPTLQTVPEGCPFNSRCSKAFSKCFQSIPPEVKVLGQVVRCHLYHDKGWSEKG